MSEASVETEALPTNPSHDYFLHHCFVCKEVAKPGQEFIRNYGGVVCFSCRAFWRRAHQKTRTPTYHCKFESRCSVNVENRTKCKRCRYDRCKMTGMTPEAILTEEQKRVRFRNLIKKQKSKRKANADADAAANANASVRPTEAEAMEVDQPPLDPAGHFEQTLRHGLDLMQQWGATAAAAYLVKQEEPSELQPPTTTSMASCDKATRIIRRKLEDIVAVYESTLKSVEVLAGQNFFADLMSVDNVEAEIVFWVQEMSRQFQSFALSHRNFVDLCVQDQETLLRRNTGLYVQLQVASCLAFAGSTVVDLRKLEPIKRVLKQNADISQYVKLIGDLRILEMFGSVALKPVFCYNILFDFDKSVYILNVDKLEDVSVVNYALFDATFPRSRSHATYSLEKFVGTLKEMADFCSENVLNGCLNGILQSFRTKLSAVPNRNLALPYTDEEEEWFKHLHCHYDDAFKSVSVGFEIISEYMMYSLDVPLSKRYILKYFSVVSERMKRILKILPGFDELPPEVKEDIIKRQGRLGLAFILIRAENFDTGFEQAKNGFSELDDIIAERNYHLLYEDTSKIKKVSLRNISVMDEARCREYGQLAKLVKPIVLDQAFYKLSLLQLLTNVSLLDPDSGELSNPLLSLNQNYGTLMRRRIQWMAEKEGVEPKAETYPSVNTAETFTWFQKLAAIMDVVAVNASSC